MSVKRSGLLAGRTCVVTGGARGIGRGICERFAEEGAAVVVCDLLEAEGEALSEELRRAGAQSEFVHMNVADRDSVGAAASRAAEAFGGVDVLAANAGILAQDYLLEMDEAVWQRTLDVNLTGVFRCCQAFGRLLVEQGRGGRIIITSSIGGLRGGAFYSAYSASKFGVIGLAESFAVEVAHHGILVNCVCPGVVKTPMMAQLLADQADALGRKVDDLDAENVALVALGRMAEPREVADAFVYFASPLSGYVTGQRLVVDGGMLIT
jgi:NAD(P)-dependent dehydrogenase (short-subunit alcohol dehydrogenase family)